MKILDVNDLLDAAKSVDLPGFDKHLEAIEAAVDALAEDIAAHFQICHVSTAYEPGFGGLCAEFAPEYEGQECPDEIDEGDPDGEWE